MTKKIDFTKLDRLKEKLDGFRPLSAEVSRNLREDILLRWTYHSNAIEGNTLSLRETKVVLEGIAVGGKSLREHFEAINHREAILFLEDLVKEKSFLSENQIKSIHRLILKHIDDKNAGVYRNSQVLISGARHVPPDALRVVDAMQSLVAWHPKEGQRLHPVERAARIHGEFVKIHPFFDGNGRTSRLLMNLELMKAGFPPAVLTVDKRLAYYQALDEAHVDRRYDPFIRLIADCVEQSFEPYWKVLGG